jgi:hypothetical protein
MTRQHRPWFQGLTVALLLLSASTRLCAEPQVDLQLVIAVDISYSMDLEEQRLQRDGYVAALRDPELIKSMRSGPNGRIAITYFEWAGPGSQRIIMPWTVLDGEASAVAFADKLAAMPISRWSMTSISSALDYGEKLFEVSGVVGGRRVIDVSGDGPNNAGAPIVGVRDGLVQRGITINGLPIVIKVDGPFDIPDLDYYYEECVIGGTGSFMIPIRERVQFQSATRRKLMLEIAGLTPQTTPPAHGGTEPRVIRTQAKGEGRKAGEVPERAPMDCMIGEKLRTRWYGGSR